MTTRIYADAISTEIAPAVTKYVSEFGVMCEYLLTEDLNSTESCVLRIRDVASNAILADFISTSAFSLIDGTLSIGLPEINTVFGSGSLVSPGRYPVYHRYSNRTIEFQVYVYGISTDDVASRINELSVLDELARVQSASHSEPQLILEYKWYGLTELTTFDIVGVSVAMPDGYIGIENLNHNNTTSLNSVTVTLNVRPFAYGRWQEITDGNIDVIAWSDVGNKSFIQFHSNIIGGDSPCPVRIKLVNNSDNVNNLTISSHVGHFGIDNYNQYLASEFENGSPLWGAYLINDTNEHLINKTLQGIFTRYYYQVPHWNLDPSGIPMDIPAMWGNLGWFNIVSQRMNRGKYVVYARMRDSSANIPDGNDEVFRIRLKTSPNRTDEYSLDQGTVVFGYNEISQTQIGPTFKMVRLGEVTFPLQSITSEENQSIWFCIEGAVFGVNYNLPTFILDIDYVFLMPVNNGLLVIEGLNDFDVGKTVSVNSDIQSIQQNGTGIENIESAAVSGIVIGQYPMLIPGMDNSIHFLTGLDYYDGAHAANGSMAVSVNYRPTYLFIAHQTPFIP